VCHDEAAVRSAMISGRGRVRNARRAAIQLIDSATAVVTLLIARAGGLVVVPDPRPQKTASC